MKKSAIVFLIFLIVFCPFYSVAENKVILDYNGVQGIWFDEPTATKMLEDLTELSVLRNTKIPTLEADIQLHKKNIEAYALELTVTEQIAEKYEGAMTKCEETRAKDLESYQKAMNQEDKWYKSRTFVFILGIFTGGLLSVGLVFGLQGAK
jgi:hypothetical protein